MNIVYLSQVFRSSLISFSPAFLKFHHTHPVHFKTFIHGYLIIFGAIVSGIAFKNFDFCLLSLYRHKIDVHVLLLYLAAS